VFVSGLKTEEGKNVVDGESDDEGGDNSKLRATKRK
jgi:hypothetical protein